MKELNPEQIEFFRTTPPPKFLSDEVEMEAMILEPSLESLDLPLTSTTTTVNSLSTKNKKSNKNKNKKNKIRAPLSTLAETLEVSLTRDENVNVLTTDLSNS